MQMVIKK